MAGGTNIKSVLPTEVMKQLQGLAEDAEKIVDGMLDAGMEAVRPTVERDLKKSLSENATGSLESSMTEKFRTYKKDGSRAKVLSFRGKTVREPKTPRGKVQEVRNNAKAAYLEYGTPRRKPNPQQARPFMKTAFDERNGAIRRAMEEEFDRLTKKYQN